MEIISEITKISRLHDQKNALLLLRKKYEEVDWDRCGMSKIPPLKLRNLCSKHKESLTAANWARHGHSCACEWTVRVEDQLVAAELLDAKEIIKYGVNVLSVLKGQRPSDEQLLPRAGGSGPAVAGQLSAADVAAQKAAANLGSGGSH